MKKIVLSAILALSLLSCSKEDDNVTPSLIEIKQYNHFGNPNEAIQHFHFSDGKLTSIANYDAATFVKPGVLYQYYEGGRLSGILKSSEKYAYSYDAEGRLTFLRYDHTETDSYTITYSYSGNIITATKTGADSSVKTFFLNSDGLIYKEVSDNASYEVTYDGFNAISAVNQGGSTRTFEYENEPEKLLPTGLFTGTYLPNAVLINEQLAGAETYSSNKYLIRETNNLVTVEHHYSFNGNGYPVRRLDCKNGVLQSEAEYIYE